MRHTGGGVLILGIQIIRQLLDLSVTAVFVHMEELVGFDIDEDLLDMGYRFIQRAKRCQCSGCIEDLP